LGFKDFKNQEETPVFPNIEAGIKKNRNNLKNVSDISRIYY